MAAGQFSTPLSYFVTASGGTALRDCPGLAGGGYASMGPQFTLFLSGMEQSSLILSADTSCDSTMLVNSASGQWFFDDDSNGGLNPLVELSGAMAVNGRVDVWVGTYGGGTCDGTFTMQAVPVVAPTPPMPTPAGGCPTWNTPGQTFNLTGSDLYSADTFQTMASGSTDVSACGIPGFGFANAAPNFSFMLSGMEQYGRLEILVTSSCDSTLLVNDATTAWHFDDDSNGGLNPMLNLTNTAALNGRVDIWIGSFGGTSCPATIELETWHN